jgi:hypothetical protein
VDCSVIALRLPVRLPCARIGRRINLVNDTLQGGIGRNSVTKNPNRNELVTVRRVNWQQA